MAYLVCDKWSETVLIIIDDEDYLGNNYKIQNYKQEQQKNGSCL